MAALWTVAVVAVSAAGAYWQMERHEAAVLQTTDHRLSALIESLDITFQQLEGLPRALARQSSIRAFLADTQMRGASSNTESGRAAAAAFLRRQASVRNMSALLRETARDFHLNDISLMDREGNALADSRMDEPLNVLGANFKTRRYFTEAVESGHASQFAVGRITGIPGFYFAARVGGEDDWLGLTVVKQDSAAFARILEDAQRRLFVTDAQGVIVMSSHAPDLLKHAPLHGPLTADADLLRRLYVKPPAPLPWKVSPAHVRERELPDVVIDGRHYLGINRPLQYGGLTAWALVRHDDASPVALWVLGGGLVLVSGYGVLGLMAQRARRMTVLTQAQQDLQSMAHALPLVVFRFRKPINAPGYFSFIGQGLKDTLGLEPEALYEDPELPWRLIDSPRLVPPAEPVEFAVNHGGARRWVRCHSTPSTQPNGSVTYNGYWLDITERKATETRSHAVFKHSPMAFLFFDEKGIFRCNPAALDLFGAPNENALLGLTPYQPPLSPLVQPDGRKSADIVEAGRDRIEGQGQPMTIEWRHHRLDGTPFDAEVVVIPFEQEGRHQVCAIVQDITQRKQTEAAMREARLAAEAAAHAKARFLANMSHEIRTPMNAVMGMTHLALLEELPARARGYVDRAHRAARNLLQILDDILDLSKIESGKLELERADFRLEQLLANVTDVLGVRAEDKRLELLITADPDLPTALVGDPMRLGQVLINLGANAIKFTEHGEVLIGVESRRQDDHQIELHFWVRDTGIGIDPEALPHLFQPFTQGDISTTRQYGGTGLGLAISRQLVEMMNGRLWAESEPAHGSTFHFTATLGLQEQAPPRRALLAGELHGRRVLLVDDNALARDVLGHMLRQMALEVDTAASGEQGLRRLREAYQADRAHDLIVTDWQMPGMDGVAFARQALSLPPGQRPCVLLVTTFARQEALKAAEGLPLVAVLNKPVTPSTLHDAVARALGRQVARSATTRQTGDVLENAQRQLAGARVLLAEDQPLNRELACDILQRAGIEVVTATNGQEALDTIEHQGPFDGVLMDCQMPVMDGYTAVKRIREHPRWSHLPVIAMTASAMASDRERVLASGMNDHITKPLELSSMFAIMARWIVPAHPAIGPVARLSLPQDPGDSGPMPLTGPLGAASLSTALDTADGLARCLGNLDLYRRLLLVFDTDQQDFGLKFNQARRQGDATTMRRLAHTLKGLAANLGAKALQGAAAELETLCEQGPDSPIEPAFERTLAALNAVRLEIHSLMQAPRDPASPLDSGGAP